MPIRTRRASRVKGAALNSYRRSLVGGAMFRRARKRLLKLRSKVCAVYVLCIFTSYCIATLILAMLDYSERNRGPAPDGATATIDRRRRRNPVVYEKCPWDDELTIPESVRSSGSCYGNDGNSSASSICESITCPKLLIGDGRAVRAAEEFTKKHQRRALKDDQVLEMASNCSSLYDQGGYVRTPLRTSDVEFPIAFNFLLHFSAVHFERLLRAIYRPQNVYCVHVDANSSPAFYEAVAAVAKCFGNVFMSEVRQHIVYGGFSRLKADINCMKDLSTPSTTVRWRYLLNLPGLVYPLRTPEEMVDILRIYNGANDIEGQAADSVIYSHFQKVWHECFALEKMIWTRKWHVPPPYGIEIVRGSAYGVFSRAFVEFVLNDWRAKDLLEWSRVTYSPDEHYWSTLHHLYYNPQLPTPGGYPGLPESKPWLALYVKRFTGKEHDWCAGYNRRGYCVLGVGDLAQLVPHEEFFVGKFDLDRHPLAFECMEAWLRYRVRCAVPLDLEFYRGLSFITRG